MTFVESTPETIPPVVQLEEIKPIKVRKKRAPKHDFLNGAGRVFAHRHDNGKGWVADTAKVDDTVYVGPRCEIFDAAIVRGKVRLEGKARVSGGAVVSGNVLMNKNAHVYGAAVVRDTTTLTDSARVFGSAHVSGTSRIIDSAAVFASAQVFSTTITGSATVQGSALVVRSMIQGFVEIKGNCSVIHGTIHGRAKILEQAQFIRSTIHNHSTNDVVITDSAIVADQSTIYSPIICRDHAILVHSTLAMRDVGLDPNTENELPTIAGRVVFHHQTFSTRAAMQNYLNLLHQHGGRQGVAQILPNGQVAGFPARQIAVTPAGPRRLMRLQGDTQ